MKSLRFLFALMLSYCVLSLGAEYCRATSSLELPVPQGGQGSVHGTVISLNGAPLQNAVVTAEGAGGGAEEAFG